MYPLQLEQTGGGKSRHDRRCETTALTKEVSAGLIEFVSHAVVLIMVVVVVALEQPFPVPYYRIPEKQPSCSLRELFSVGRRQRTDWIMTTRT